ncbi:MAG: hypothetical protein M1825_004169 [Sarcosagium campestre]|nr:MAG: hypothetical protein M1825_004169 [Sarcosagium campestre]
MTALRPFHPLDLFKFNLTNLDSLTETYDVGFYLTYLARWPDLFNVVEGQNVMGKMEASPQRFRHSEHSLPWHAHITALTVAPQARRQGLARLLTQSLERAGDEYNGWFVDLFVRKSNKIAIDMYSGMG